MLKISLFLLLATSAMPAIAQRGEDGEPEARRAAQSEQSESRSQQRAERLERREAREQSSRQVEVERQVQPEGPRSERDQQQVQQQQENEGSRSERVRRFQQVQEQQEVEGQGGRNERLEQRRQRQLEASQQGQLGAQQGGFRNHRTIRPAIGQSGPVRTDVRTDHRRYRDRDGRDRWTNHWRNDRRYDWRHHRDRNRFIFRIGFYSDPFGYGYRRFGAGSFLYPNYYQSNYWINDPWQYRLPPAYGPYRWVRYHSDALLIDTYSGEVVDVIHGFFW